MKTEEEYYLKGLQAIIDEAPSNVKAITISGRSVTVYGKDLEMGVLFRLNQDINKVFAVQNGTFGLMCTTAPIPAKVVADYYVQRYIANS